MTANSEARFVQAGRVHGPDTGKRHGSPSGRWLTRGIAHGGFASDEVP